MNHSVVQRWLRGVVAQVSAKQIIVVDRIDRQDRMRCIKKFKTSFEWES